MRRLSLLIFAVLMTITTNVPPADAQQDPNFEIGLRPYASYQMGDIDSVNVSNGGLSVDIPLISYPQRGGKLNLTLALHYFNGSAQNSPQCYYGSCFDVWSWSESGFSVIDKGSLFVTSVYEGTADGIAPFYQYGVQEPDGAVHTLGTNATNSLESFDATGYHVVTGNTSTMGPFSSIVDPTGTSRFPQSQACWEQSFPLGSPSTNVGYITGGDLGTGYGDVTAFAPGGWTCFQSREDTNGNEILFSSTAGWTDTMGRQIPIPTYSTSSSNFTGCTGSLPIAFVELWNLPGVNGGTYPVKLCYVAISGVYTETFDELQSVVLPNGTAWTFSYWALTLQGVYGPSESFPALQEITFPSGGTLSYQWTTTNVCPTVPAYKYNFSVYSRTLNPNDGVTPASTWNYSYGGQTFTGGQWNPITNIITDPLGNDAVHYIGLNVSPVYQWPSCFPYEVETQYYQGSHTSGTLLKTINTTYSWLVPQTDLGGDNDIYSYYTIANVVPTTQATVWPNGQQSQVTYTYDSGFNFQWSASINSNDQVVGSGHENVGTYGKELSKNEYDYGGTLLRTTTTSWLALNNSNYLTYNLFDLPSSVQVTGSGPGSTTSYNYDQYSLASSGITTQHVTPSNGSYRGNLTSASRWLSGSTTATTNCNISVSSGNLTSYKTYNDTGTVATSVDWCGTSYTDSNHTTTYTYSSAYVGALPTTIANPLGQSTTSTYDFNTGLLLTSQDPNLLTTTYTYDQMLRTLQIAKPDGGQSLFCYTDTGTESGGGTCSQSSPPYDVVITETINSSTNRNSVLQVDGVGREIRQAVTNGENGYDEVDTCYDGDGRVSFKSYAYQTASVSGSRCQNSGTPGDATVYDGLGRPTSVTHSDNSVISTSYTGSATTVTDEQGKTRQSSTDGLGRMTQVVENPSGLNYTTTYTYDALDDLTGVSQSSSRQRTFVYDSLSHLASSTNPESNWSPSNLSYVATTYSYDADGNLINKTEPAQNQQGTSTVTLTYCYDVLNRIISKAYTQASCNSTHGMSSSPVASYYYDGAHQLPGFCRFPDISGLNIGHRNAMCDAGGWESWSYQIVSGSGWQITDERQTNSITTTAVYQDNFLGLPTSIQYPSGRTINYNYNVAGRPTYALDATTSVYYANTVHYAANGSPCWSVYGGAITRATTFNPRLQPLEMQGTGIVVTYPGSCSGLGQTGNLFDLTFNFNYGTGDNGNVMGITNNIDGTRSQSFTYDALNRILSAYTASTYSTSPAHCWGENYQFDNQASGGAWGNLTAITAMTGNYSGCTQESGLSVTATVQNQISNASTYGYDTAGNMTTNGGNTYTYDAENHLTSTAGVTYTYDGDGKRVMKSSGPIYRYGLNGEVLDETDLTGSTTDSSFYEYVFLGGARIARHDSSNNVYYYTSDHLGTSRVIAEVPSGSTTATLCYDADFYPFGGERAYTYNCSQNYKFTGKERDVESCAAGACLDNFGARFDSSSIGRFMTPDPLGGKRTDPQTLNKYSYVRGNPVTFTDPTGLYTCVDDQNHCQTQDDKNLHNALLALRLSGAEGALEAYNFGKEGDDNGVHVDFKSEGGMGGKGILGETLPTADRVVRDAQTGKPLHALDIHIDVNILTGLNQMDLEQTVAHEGAHVTDAMNFIHSFDFSSEKFNKSFNYFHINTEVSGFEMGATIEPYRNLDCGNGHKCDIIAGDKHEYRNIIRYLNSTRDYRESNWDFQFDPNVWPQ